VDRADLYKNICYQRHIKESEGSILSRQVKMNRDVGAFYNWLDLKRQEKINEDQMRKQAQQQVSSNQQYE